ncbi:MAG: nickel-dependent hydrogenase large subunit [Beijerinckiaceae bacterium]
METLFDTIRKGLPVENSRPRPRVIIDSTSFLRAVREISKGRGDLVGLWSDGADVHVAVTVRERDGIDIISIKCPNGHFPSVGRMHPPGLRLERTIHDLYGLVPEAAPDPRPWLDHGRWGLVHPCGRPESAEPSGGTYDFLAAEGEYLHQIPVGPVHAGIIEPGHFRFSANGETIVRLEERFGYVHKGIDKLMAGADLAKAARITGRVSGDSTVAYALAFARAVEAALGLEVPRRAHYLRALMAELERIANHFGDIGAICNDAAFALMLAHCSVLRELVLRAAATCFGHRLMMDQIVPGGVTRDLTDDGIGVLFALLAELKRRFPHLIRVYDNTTSLQDRTVQTGFLAPEFARQYACGGFIGRASGRDFDARRRIPYEPYADLSFEVPVRQEGDVDARIWIRIEEVTQSLALIAQIIEKMPRGPVQIPAIEPPGEAREGFALVEGFRGDIFAWVRIDSSGKIAHCHLRDPSWFQWPLLEAAIEGNIVGDFPLCNKSFNCSYSGHDL